tara:strand:- start:167 stop:898 length:732 start_codon:yes stop_codon:yes gene_type:complete
VSKIKQKRAFEYNYSPNFYAKKRKKKDIKEIVIHYTGMKNELAAIKKLTNFKSNVSCNYFIKLNGKIIQMVPDEYASWHAGFSSWKNKKFLNKSSIGIEIQNPGHRHKYSNFSYKQVESTIKLLKILTKKFKINKKLVLGHSDIAPDRKKDPGEKFPWKLLSKHKLSIWHNLNKIYLTNMRGIKLDSKNTKTFYNLLKNIGYRAKKQKKLIQSFQRRFRPELINGIPDKECEVIAKNLIKCGI